MGEIYSYKHIKKTRNISIDNLTLQLKDLQKEQSKSKASRKKEIIKIRAEINEVENN